jgi:hypothetical protein
MCLREVVEKYRKEMYLLTGDKIYLETTYSDKHLNQEA